MAREATDRASQDHTEIEWQFTAPDLGAVREWLAGSPRLEPTAVEPALPPATLFLMGRCAEREAHTAVRIRRRFAKAWRRVRGGCWKRLRRAMEALAASVVRAGAQAPGGAEGVLG